MVFVERGEVPRQYRAETRAGETPVVFILVPGFQAADQQIVDAAAPENAETVDKGGFAEGPDAPVSLSVRRGNDNLRVFGVVGGIEFVRRQKLPVRAGNRRHGHHAAGFIPDGFQNLPVFGEDIARPLFFGGNQKTVFSPIGKLRNGVTLLQIGNHFLFNFHQKPSIHLWPSPPRLPSYCRSRISRIWEQAKRISSCQVSSLPVYHISVT